MAVIRVQAIDLVNLTDKLTTRDTIGNAYYDTYINDCLNKINLCDAGFIYALNVNVVYPQAKNYDKTDTSPWNGLIEMFTSVSHYANAGVFLHQVNTRGDNYLRLAFANNNDLYVTKVKFIYLSLVTFFK